MSTSKSWIEVIIMPVVIAGVGLVGTYFITQQQEANAIAKADSDRQIKILEIFAEKITHNDLNQRLLAIKLLRSLDQDLAERLAIAVAEIEPESSVTKIAAETVAREANALLDLKPRVYLHVSGDAERESAKAVIEVLENNGWAAPGIQRVGSRSPKTSQFRYFKQAEKTQAEEIQRKLAERGYDVEIEYLAGYENSKSIRPNHFEIWFAAGQPGSR